MIFSMIFSSSHVHNFSLRRSEVQNWNKCPYIAHRTLKSISKAISKAIAQFAVFVNINAISDSSFAMNYYEYEDNFFSQNNLGIHRYPVFR